MKNPIGSDCHFKSKKGNSYFFLFACYLYLLHYILDYPELVREGGAAGGRGAWKGGIPLLEKFIFVKNFGLEGEQDFEFAFLFCGT